MAANAMRPAFPVSIDMGDLVGTERHGLAKRELFAAMAMQGILASRDDSSGTEIANYAIAMADELLERLSKSDG